MVSYTGVTPVVDHTTGLDKHSKSCGYVGGRVLFQESEKRDHAPNTNRGPRMTFRGGIVAFFRKIFYMCRVLSIIFADPAFRKGHVAPITLRPNFCVVSAALPVVGIGV